MMASRSAAPRSVSAYARWLWASGRRYRTPASCSSFSRVARMFVGAPSVRCRQTVDDAQSPALADEIERRGQPLAFGLAGHALGGPSGLIQNGANW